MPAGIGRAICEHFGIDAAKLEAERRAVGEGIVGRG